MNVMVAAAILCILVGLVVGLFIHVHKLSYHCSVTDKDFRPSLRQKFTALNWSGKHQTYCPYCKDIHWVTKARKNER